jgi:hypothetical protein
MQVEKKKYSGSQFIVDFVLLALFCALVLAMVFLGLWAWRVTGSGAGFGGGLIGGAAGVLVIWLWGKIQTAEHKRRVSESEHTWKNGCWFVVQEEYDGQRRRVGVPWRAQKDALEDLAWYRGQGYKNVHLGGAVDFEFDTQADTMGTPKKKR